MSQTALAAPAKPGVVITIEPGAGRIETDLCTELETYCKTHRLPYMSADELQAELKTRGPAYRCTDNATAHIDWLGDYIARWDAWEAACALMNRLANKYPNAGFDLVTKEDISEHDNPECPPYVVSFTHREQCIVDPLTYGFGACDSVFYGIEHEDAEAIRAFNNIVLG